MADALELVHVSGGLLSPAIIADALSDAPKRKEFQPSSFAYTGHDAESPTQFVETVEMAFQLGCESYDVVARDLDTLSLSDLREKWLRPLLGLLDLDPQFQRGRLKSEDGREDFDISFLAWKASDAPPVHLVKPDLDEATGRENRSAHDEVQSHLNSTPALWGVVANGRRLRLLRDFYHVYTKAFVGFDLDAIFESRDFVSFRALYRLCHRSRFEAPSGAPLPLELLFDTSQAEGIQIGRQLQPQVRVAIELLAEGLFGPELRAKLDDPKQARALFRELLIVIYRILFLLFAEQRRMLPAQGIYAETYSLAGLTRITEQKNSEPRRHDLWEGLKVTFQMLSQGATDIEVFPFNGQLFDLRRTARLMAQSCENKLLLKAVYALTHVDVGGLRQRVNYGELGVEELGSVYETLLGYTPRCAPQPTPVEGKIVPKGGVYLAPLTTERKDLGAHYTRPPLVDFDLSISLDRLIKERLEDAERLAAGKWRDESEKQKAFGTLSGHLHQTLHHKKYGRLFEVLRAHEAANKPALKLPIKTDADWASVPLSIRRLALAEHTILDIRVCDCACGSGAILVGAIDRLALALATVWAEGQKPTEAALQEARREALAHCIYGVDKDEFAVELCKVALWIHCAVPNLPLSFLDHRIQHGDSLVGWPLLNVPSTIPVDAYTVPGNLGRDEDSRRLKAFLQSAREANQLAVQGQGELGQLPSKPDIRVDFPAVMNEEERIPGDVERKDAAFKCYLESDAYRHFKAAADLWTASFFWSHEVGAPAPTTEHYRRALNGKFDPDQVKAAQELLEEFPAFHWPLRFPEIAARGGFDCFVGNPPWEQVKMQEQEWFAPRAPEIANLPSAPRRAAILALKEATPKLWHKWRVAQVAYIRLAEFMRNSGRYSPSEHEPNTYLLFTDLVADALRSNGRAGIIVKTALGTDKSASSVFHRLVKADQIEEFHDIVNGGPTGATLIFVDVDAKERFVVLGLRGRGGISGELRGFASSIMNWNIAEAVQRPRQQFTFEILRALNPKTATLTSFRSGGELEIALQVHRRTANAETRLCLLDFDEGGSNPWGLKYARLFDSSGAAEQFLRREIAEREGWTLEQTKLLRRAKRDAATGELELMLDSSNSEFDEAVPLYEGQMANRYDHRAKTYDGYTGPNKYGMAPGIPEVTDDEKADPNFEIEPRYWIPRETASARMRALIGEHIPVGFRNTARPWRDSRCAKAAILPRYAATDGLPVLGVPKQEAFEFLGIFNATVFDFLMKGHMPGPNVRLVWMLSQIPTPQPGTLDKRVAEHAEKLSLTSHSVAHLFNREPHIWNQEERYALDVEIDALVAHAYGVTRAQYEVVLNSFEVFARVEIQKHGRYRFKEDCLVAFARLG